MWGTFVAGPYIDAPDSAHRLNQRAIAVVQGAQPILVTRRGGCLSRGNAGETFVYDDSGDRRRVSSTARSTSPVPFTGVAPALSQTHVDKYEEQGVFVHARGLHIADM